MGKIFYTTNSNVSSEQCIRTIVAEHYGIREAEIARTPNGKPYLKNVNGLYFSISHTREKLFIAFSEQNVGLDAEPLSRRINYQNILRKFPIEERAKISNLSDFLKHWTARESAVKYLDGTLAADLKKLSYGHGCITHTDGKAPLLAQHFLFEEHLLCVCSKNGFQEVTFIPICPL